MARAKGRATKPKVDLVLDNSIVMAWSFEDETNEYAEAVLDRLANARAIVPALWPLEVANALAHGRTPQTLHRGGDAQVDGHPGIAAHHH